LHGGSGVDGYHPHNHPQQPAPGDQLPDDHHQHRHHFLPIKEEILENEDTTFYSNKNTGMSEQQHPEQDFSSGNTHRQTNKQTNKANSLTSSPQLKFTD
jgi:hypothetical protein